MPLTSFGVVVQSVVSQTKSLGEDSLSLIVLTKSTAIIFLLKICEGLLHCKSSSYFFGKTWQCLYFICIKFENLTSC